MSSLYQFWMIHIGSDNNSGWIEVIKQCLGFSQKFRAEEDMRSRISLLQRLRISDRNRALDDDDCFSVYRKDQINHLFHGRGIKVVLAGVIVGRCSNYHEVGICIGAFSIHGCSQKQRLLFQILLDVFILDRGNSLIDLIHFLLHDIHCGDFMMLTEQYGNGKTDIAGTGYCNPERWIRPCALSRRSFFK